MKRRDDSIERYCPYCKATYPLESEHWRWYVSKGGGYVRCRAHEKELMRNRYAENPTRYRLADKRRRLKRRIV